jgi:DNA-binding NtrC family response regulator
MTVNPYATMRILVVDDERLIRWSVRQTLAASGHDVLEAADARSAVRLLGEPGPPVDVVLLDYRLPDSDDLELLAEIRRLSPRSAVILMTAYGTPDVIEAALELGAYDVIGKPFDLAYLESMIVTAHQERGSRGRARHGHRSEGGTTPL